MDKPQNFRSAFNGFNREDVVSYISFLSTKHDKKVSELRDEAEELRAQLEECNAKADSAEALVREVEQLRADLEKAQSEKQDLEKELVVMQAQLDARNQELAEKDAILAKKAEALTKREEEIELIRGELDLAKTSGVIVAPKQEEPAVRWEEELNAYRRAESCERRARERVNQMYDQAGGALAEASLRVEQTVSQISELTAKVEADVAVLMKAMSDSEHVLADTAMMLGAIRPEME